MCVFKIEKGNNKAGQEINQKNQKNQKFAKAVITMILIRMQNIARFVGRRFKF